MSSTPASGSGTRRRSPDPNCHTSARLRACWTDFDGVAARVSAEMRKGVRGGGRDRDQIFRHVVVNDAVEFANKIGLRFTREEALTPDGLRSFRDTYCAAFRDHNARGLPARSWELQFRLRRSAYHAMDHAWEMLDKDPSGSGDGAGG